MNRWDSLNELAPALREANVMVLGMRSASGAKGTQFLLVQPPARLEEYFLLDDEMFSGSDGLGFDPSIVSEKLLSSQLLPTLSETSFVTCSNAR